MPAANSFLASYWSFISFYFYLQETKTFSNLFKKSACFELYCYGFYECLRLRIEYLGFQRTEYVIKTLFLMKLDVSILERGISALSFSDFSTFILNYLLLGFGGTLNIGYFQAICAWHFMKVIYTFLVIILLMISIHHSC